MTAPSPKDIFLEALDRPADEREAFLAAQCGDDAALRERVEQLLAAHDEAEHVVGAPLSPAAHGSALQDMEQLDVGVGDEIGPYRLVEVLGEGGFGRVFLADQEQPVARRVALKVLKLGMDSRQVMARFEAERKTLALMNHPHIAGVLDAGATPSGRPYFVIELVDGEAITEHCARRRLPLDDRLRLFVDTCLAIQHAHSKGVLHRDIKPNNVLVAEIDGVAQPRVIDFGVAKAIAEDDGSTALTGEGHLVGTPTYMSPEQVGGERDIDTRSDVHALGVMLFELLVGRTPFEAEGDRPSSLLEISQRIRHDDAPAPGRSPRQTGGVAGDIPSELDWIVLRCLEKERDRRYPTAAALARDVERFLRHEPVEAAPPSATYRLRKLVRRHRVAAAGIVVAVLALVVAVVGTTLGLVEAARANAELDEAYQRVTTVNTELDDAYRRVTSANEELDEAYRRVTAVNAFLTHDLLSAARPSPRQGEGTDVLMSEVLDAAARRIEDAAAPGGRFADAPMVEATVRAAIGDTYAALGRQREGLPHLERARAVYERELGAASPETLEREAALCQALFHLGEHVEAEERVRAALPALRKVRGPDDPVTLQAVRSLGMATWRQGRHDEAAAILDEAITAARSRIGDDDRRLLDLMSSLAIVETERGRPELAEELFTAVLERRLELDGPNEPGTLTARRHLGTFFLSTGRLAEARPLLEQVLEDERRIMGPDHPNTIAAVHTLGGVLSGLGEWDAADELLTDALDAIRGHVPEGHPELLVSLRELGKLRANQGRLTEAEELFREAYRSSAAAKGEDHPQTVEQLSGLGTFLHRAGRLAEARPLFEEVYERTEATYGPTHMRTLAELRRLVAGMLGLGDRAAAEELLVAAMERLGDVPPESDVSIGIRSDLFLLYREARRWEEAEPILLELYEIRLASLGPENKFTVGAATLLAELYGQLDRTEEAESWRRIAEAHGP